MDLLIQIGNLYDLLLELLDELLLLVGSLLGIVGDGADFVRLLLVVVIQLGVVLGELAESFTRGRFNLETFELFDNVGLIHSLDDRIHVADELFFDYLGAV